MPKGAYWRDDELIALADLIAAGRPRQEVADVLGRSKAAIDVRARHVLCPVDGHLPHWGRPAWGLGSTRPYWTRERCLTELRRLMTQEISGRLPTGHDYGRLRRPDWPPAWRLREYWQCLSWAWLAAGAPVSRLRTRRRFWTPREKTFLLERAGTLRLSDIAGRLGRSVYGVRMMLGSKGFGLKARENAGYLSALRAATELGIRYSTVQQLLLLGLLRARYSKLLHRWLIDPADLERLKKGALMKIIVSRIEQAPIKRPAGQLKWLKLEEALDKLGADQCVVLEPEPDDGPRWSHGLRSLAKRRNCEVRLDPDGVRVWLLSGASHTPAVSSPPERNGAAARSSPGPLVASPPGAVRAAAVS